MVPPMVPSMLDSQEEKMTLHTGDMDTGDMDTIVLGYLHAIRKIPIERPDNPDYMLGYRNGDNDMNSTTEHEKSITKMLAGLSR